MSDYILEKYKIEYASEIMNKLKAVGMNYSPETAVEFVLDELRMCSYYDIYDDTLPDDESKAKCYIKVMFYGYEELLGITMRMVPSSPEEFVKDYRRRKADDDYRACVMVDGRVDMDAFYATLKKHGKLDSFITW